MKRFGIAFLFLCGCAGMERECTSCGNENFGADWVIVQYGYDGKPINCWELKESSVTNERGSDGIFWQEPDGKMVHISGWYNRVQVHGNDWKGAAKAIGVEDDQCKDGRYVVVVAKDGG